MNFSNPPPVPETPDDTCTSGCAALYSSTNASTIGATVDEPSPNTDQLIVHRQLLVVVYYYQCLSASSFIVCATSS